MADCPVCSYRATLGLATEVTEANTTVSISGKNLIVCPECAAQLVLDGARLEYQP